MDDVDTAANAAIIALKADRGASTMQGTLAIWERQVKRLGLVCWASLGAFRQSYHFTDYERRPRLDGYGRSSFASHAKPTRASASLGRIGAKRV